MTNDSRLKIQELWVNQQCPIVNALIYGDGVIKRLELIRDKLWKPEKFTLQPENQTTVIDFLSNAPDDLTSLSQLCEKIVAETNLRLVAGEGGWGGDGFIAVEDMETKELRFLLFFDNSNPFVEIDFSGSEITAVSNLGEKWLIPLDKPERITVLPSS